MPPAFGIRRPAPDALHPTLFLLLQASRIHIRSSVRGLVPPTRITIIDAATSFYCVLLRWYWVPGLTELQTERKHRILTHIPPNVSLSSNSNVQIRMFEFEFEFEFAFSFSLVSIPIGFMYLLTIVLMLCVHLYFT